METAMRTLVRWLGASLVVAAAGVWTAACDSTSGTPTSTFDAPAPGGGSVATPDTIRFLEQATFGPTEDLAAAVQAQGIAAYLDDQLATSASSLGTYGVVTKASGVFCAGQNKACVRDNYTAFPVTVQFFRNALSAPDQLRQRVAFALGQILVVSADEVKFTYAIAAYQELLLAGAFGNFRQLMEDVTKSPAMGRYLNMANNDKPDTAKGTHPNENYARELMQLFTIGLVALNADGSEVTGPVATYDQATVSEMARVFAI
jgi:uncharacterized protein (DUF1800 family)